MIQCRQLLYLILIILTLPSAIFTPDQCVCVIFMCPVNEPGRCSPVFQLLSKLDRGKKHKLKIKDNDLVYIKQLKLFFRQKFVIPTFGSSVNFIFFLFQPHRNRGVKDGYQILSWDKSQTQVIPSLSTIISYLQRSNVLWCPPLVLLSQTRFLLLLSGSYGYDRSCWFQAKMIINIRNELPSSCLGSLHQKLNW